MRWQTLSQGYDPPHRPNHSCYKPGALPDANTADMSGSENSIKFIQFSFTGGKSGAFFWAYCFNKKRNCVCLRDAAFWLNSGSTEWRLAGVASLWLLSVNCSSTASLHQINTSLMQSSPSLSFSQSKLTVRQLAVCCPWRESDAMRMIAALFACVFCDSVCMCHMFHVSIRECLSPRSSG